MDEIKNPLGTLQIKGGEDDQRGRSSKMDMYAK